jgi:hypothetical protein
LLLPPVEVDVTVKHCANADAAVSAASSNESNGVRKS